MRAGRTDGAGGRGLGAGGGCGGFLRAALGNRRGAAGPRGMLTHRGKTIKIQAQKPTPNLQKSVLFPTPLPWLPELPNHRNAGGKLLTAPGTTEVSIVLPPL